MGRVLNPIVSESYMKGYIKDEGLIKPEGKITITENGTDIDVAQFRTADVSVSGGGESPINYLKLNITNVSTSYDLYDVDDTNADSSLNNYFTNDFGATYNIYNPNRNAMVLTGTVSKNLIAEKNGGKGVAYLIPVWQTDLNPGQVARFDIGTSMYESIESVNNVTLDETPFICTIELTDPTKSGEINISLKEYIPD